MPNSENYLILFVDDEPELCEIFKENMEEAGFDVLCETDVDSALVALARFSDTIKVIVSDFNMPEKNGLDLFAATMERWPYISRILVTAISDIKIAERAINNGHVSAFFNKPWDDDDIVTMIKKAIERTDDALYHKKLENMFKSLDNTDYLDSLLRLVCEEVVDISSGLLSYRELGLTEPDFDVEKNVDVNVHALLLLSKNSLHYQYMMQGNDIQNTKRCSLNNLTKLALIENDWVMTCFDEVSINLSHDIVCNNYHFSLMLTSVLMFSLRRSADGNVSLDISDEKTDNQVDLSVKVVKGGEPLISIQELKFNNKLAESDVSHRMDSLGIFFLLYCAKMFAEKIDGELHIVSNSSYTTFQFSFPL